MRCLDEETIFRLIDGQLSGAALEHVDDHIGECSECRSLVADAARSLHERATGDTTAAETGCDSCAEERLPSDLEAPLRPGTAVGRYLVGEVIAVGGMGVLYLGQDPRLNRTITLKLLREDRRAGRSAQAELLREAQAMAALSHPNVVAVYDVGTYGSQVFVAMEYVDGGTLAEWMRGSIERRPWQKTCSLFIEAGRALAAAHAVGIVHRDFKPSNVLLGKDGRVRVTDFGLARPIDAERSAGATDRLLPPDSQDFGDWDLAMTLTRAGMIKGTPAYMAPEQFTGRAVDDRTDQFSFCVALYEALFGHRPFGSDRLEELVGRVTSGQVALPADDRGVPRLIGQALLRGLSLRPEHRHPSMGDILALLSDALRTQPSRPPRRSSAKALVAIAGLVALGATGIVALLATRASSPSSALPPERRASSPLVSAANADRGVTRPHLVEQPAAPQVRAIAPSAAGAAVRPPPRRRSHRNTRPSARLRPPRASPTALPRSTPRPYNDDPLVPSFVRQR